MMIFALILISMCGPTGMNIILPSISSYQVAFETDYATAQLTLTFYLAAVAIAQLIYGPLSDRFGRLPIIYFGLSGFVVGSVLCLLAQSVEMLLVGRIVQAFGGCAGMVMGRAMVRDKYSAEQATSVIAYMTMAIVLAPTLGPALGGVLEDFYGWRSSYVFVVVMGTLVLLVVSRSLQETLPVNRRQTTHFKGMIKSFGYLLGNAKFNAYAFMVAFSTSAYFAFLGGSSYVLIDLMGATASELGLYFVEVSAFYILGNYLTARLSTRFGVNRLIALGTVLCLSGASMMVFYGYTAEHTHFTFIAMMSVIAFGNGFCVSSGMASAIGADPARVGAASGLAGFMQIGFGSLATLIVGSLFTVFPDTSMPLLLTVFGCCAISLFSFAFGQWWAHRGDRVLA